MRALPFISQITAYLTGICLYIDWEAPLTVSVAGYWQILTDTYDIHGYEQICVGEDVLKSMEVILTDTYTIKRFKQTSFNSVPQKKVNMK